MKVEEECIPCILKMTLSGLRSIDLEPGELRKIYHEIVKSIMIENRIWDITSAELVEKVLTVIIDKTDVPDPFISIKEKANTKLIAIYDKLYNHVVKSDNPLLTAAELSIFGNTIDVMLSDNPQKNLNTVLHHPTENISLHLENYDKLLFQLKKSKSILIIADNAGEVVMDKLFLEILKTENDMDIYYAVRNNPALNDVTYGEAINIGLSDTARVITNGIDGPLPGTVLSRCSRDFLDVFYSVDMVISKGGGNFESLIGEANLPANLFYLLMCKCEVHSRFFNISVGKGVIWCN